MTLRLMETKEYVMFPVHTSGTKPLATGTKEEIPWPRLELMKDLILTIYLMDRGLFSSVGLSIDDTTSRLLNSFSASILNW